MIASFAEGPTEWTLDFDATDDHMHGTQEGRFYHVSHGKSCILPLCAFCGERLLVSYLRSSNRDGARHAWAILKLLKLPTQRLREAWLEVRLIMRTDSGFCRWKMVQWCDWAGVDYVIGLARNPRLKALSAPLMAQAEAAFAAEPQKQRIFAAIYCAADMRDRPRRVIAQAEYSEQGKNPELARAQVGTIRLKLLKIGAVIVRYAGCTGSFSAVPMPISIRNSSRASAQRSVPPEPNPGAVPGAFARGVRGSASDSKIVEKSAAITQRLISAPLRRRTGADRPKHEMSVPGHLPEAGRLEINSMASWRTKSVRLPQGNRTDFSSAQRHGSAGSDTPHNRGESRRCDFDPPAIHMQRLFSDG